MKKNRYYLTVMLLAVFCFIILPGIGYAQLVDPGDDPDIPIDGGLSLLIAAGVGYGIKKAKDQRRKNRTARLKDASHSL